MPRPHKRPSRFTQFAVSATGVFLSSWHRNLEILFIAFCWLAIGTSFLIYVGNPSLSLLAPGYVGLLFLVSGILTALFAFMPHRKLLFGLSGGMACVSWFGRGASACFGAWYNGRQDWPWSFVLQVASNLLVFVFLWWFWQTYVKVWHVFAYEKFKLREQELK